MATQERSLFDYDDYKAYLREALKERGIRTRLAEALKCQTTFISQVLNGKTHFSFEHSILISEFLSLTSEEASFFMLLVQLGKAGSTKLQAFYQSQIREVRKERDLIVRRLKVSDAISQENQMIYYGVWYHSAIHILLLIPQFRTKTAIAKTLHLPLETVSSSLEFLRSIGLCTQEGNSYLPGAQRIHLSSDSPMLPKHHSNWRVKALESLDRQRPEDLHYSSVMSISEDAFQKIRSLMLELIEASEPIIKGAEDQGLYCWATDLFKVSE